MEFIEKIREQALENYIQNNPIMFVEGNFYRVNEQFLHLSKYGDMLTLDQAFIFLKNYLRSIK